MYLFIYFYKDKILIQDIKNEKDIVAFVKEFMKQCTSTDDAISSLTQHVIDNSDYISDETIQVISKLHKSHKNEMNETGYAITVLWSCICYANQDNTIDFKSKNTN